MVEDTPHPSLPILLLLHLRGSEASRDNENLQCSNGPSWHFNWGGVNQAPLSRRGVIISSCLSPHLPSSLPLYYWKLGSHSYSPFPTFLHSDLFLCVKSFLSYLQWGDMWHSGQTNPVRTSGSHPGCSGIRLAVVSLHSVACLACELIPSVYIYNLISPHKEVCVCA